MSKRRGCTNEATTGIAYLLVAIQMRFTHLMSKRNPLSPRTYVEWLWNLMSWQKEWRENHLDCPLVYRPHPQCKHLQWNKNPQMVKSSAVSVGGEASHLIAKNVLTNTTPPQSIIWFSKLHNKISYAQTPPQWSCGHVIQCDEECDYNLRMKVPVFTCTEFNIGILMQALTLWNFPFSCQIWGWRRLEGTYYDEGDKKAHYHKVQLKPCP